MLSSASLCTLCAGVRRCCTLEEAAAAGSALGQLFKPALVAGPAFSCGLRHNRVSTARCAASILMRMCGAAGVWLRCLLSAIAAVAGFVVKCAAVHATCVPCTQVYGGTARWKKLLQRPMRKATDAKFNEVVTTLKELMQRAWALQGPQAQCALLAVH